MTPIGSIPQAPPFLLERHQLAQVLCQVMFSPVLKLRQEDAVIPFQEAIRATYPHYATEKGVALILTPQGVQQQEASEPNYRFADAERGYQATLSHSFLALETRAYLDMNDFAGRLRRLAEAVHEYYEPAQITRIGLRFINEIRLGGENPTEEMRSAFSSTLLGAAGATEFDGLDVGAQQVLELADGNERMLVRHGLHADGTTVAPQQGRPVPANLGPFYLLDIDAFSDREVPFSVEGIEERLRTYHDWTRSFFAWAVDEDYRRSKLGQRDL